MKPGEAASKPGQGSSCCLASPLHSPVCWLIGALLAFNALRQPLPRPDSLQPRRLPGMHGLVWLTIGMPTVPRDADYLTGTLESLLDDLPLDSEDPLYLNVKVVVMNMSGDKHKVFQGLKKRFADPQPDDKHGLKGKLYLNMVDSPMKFTDPTPDAPEPDHLNNKLDIPGRVGRKQNCDVLNLLHALDSQSAYFMFMEDDFTTCEGSLAVLYNAVNKLNANSFSHNWLALRVSYGMNGILMRSVDTLKYMRYLEQHVARKPVDLLWQEFVMPTQSRRQDALQGTDGREMFVYKWNLFAHVGYVSSFPVRPFRKPWPQCMARMSSVWSLQDNEKFRMSCWFSSDFSPCAAKKRSVHDAPKQQVHHGKPMFGIKEAKVQTVRRGSAHWDAGSAAAMFPTSVYRSGAKGLQNSTGLQSRGEHILPIANQSQWTV